MVCFSRLRPFLAITDNDVEKAVNLFKTFTEASLTTTELLIEREKVILEKERRATIICEGQEKRETNRLMYQNAVASQAALNQVDDNIYSIKQLNWDQSEGNRQK